MEFIVKQRTETAQGWTVQAQTEGNQPKYLNITGLTMDEIKAYPINSTIKL